MENKYLKGNLKKNIAFGLSWLFPIFAIILFVLDKETLTREEIYSLVETGKLPVKSEEKVKVAEEKFKKIGYEIIDCFLTLKSYFVF